MTKRSAAEAVLLSAQQVRLFHTFGFLHVPDVFGDLLEAAGSAVERQAAGTRRSADGSLRMTGFVERDAVLGRLLLGDCDRLSRALSGPGMTYQGSEVVLDEAAGLWERRSPEPGTLILTCSLEQPHRTSGALRFLPRTHLLASGWDAAEDALRDSVTKLGFSAEDVPCSIVELAPGDLVAFDPYLLHMTGGAPAGGCRVILRYAAARPDKGGRWQSSH
ncbi:phytanoyl-CoA dioxygenase family protein [Streptomyces sp. NPDC053253]|uniref:phytanoyl-CoA dioxygenase family protein n=1 Tax=Streptomyces sp. NPDC053253 TaxID=3365699 RepID=UPI0037D40D63